MCETLVQHQETSPRGRQVQMQGAQETELKYFSDSILIFQIFCWPVCSKFDSSISD